MAQDGSIKAVDARGFPVSLGRRLQLASEIDKRFGLRDDTDQPKVMSTPMQENYGNCASVLITRMEGRRL